MKRDSYNEVINDLETYEDIARWLSIHGSYLLGWTDQESTHLDVLLTLRPPSSGNIQRGLHNSTSLLFVSVIGKDTFGFDVFNRSVELHPNYVGEKLGLGMNTTSEQLTILISEIISRLRG